MKQYLASGTRFPHPLIQIAPAYKAGSIITELVHAGMLDPLGATIFRTSDGAPITSTSTSKPPSPWPTSPTLLS